MPYNGTLPADLTAVIEAWDQLPEAIKAGILAMVHAASKSTAADWRRTPGVMRSDPVS
jgi:hypothetical protein